jgi:hypothetical protein
MADVKWALTLNRAPRKRIPQRVLHRKSNDDGADGRRGQEFLVKDKGRDDALGDAILEVDQRSRKRQAFERSQLRIDVLFGGPNQLRTQEDHQVEDDIRAEQDVESFSFRLTVRLTEKLEMTSVAAAAAMPISRCPG